MKCLQCGGEMEKKTVPYSVDRKGYHLYLGEIPAFVCTRCGEKFFDEKEVAAIQDILRNIDEKLEQVRKVA